MFGETVDFQKEFARDGLAGVSVAVSTVNISIMRAESADKVSFRFHGWSLRSPTFDCQVSDGKASFVDRSVGLMAGDLRLDVYLPADFDQAVSIKTSTGNLTVESLVASAISIDTKSGNLKAGTIRGERFDWRSTTGNASAESVAVTDFAYTSSTGNLSIASLEATSATTTASSGSRKFGTLRAARFEATATTGAIEVREATVGDSKLETTSGSINVSFAAFGSPCRLIATASTGSVKVTLPRDAGFRLDASSKNGRVSSAFKVESMTDRAAKGTVGTGAGNVTLSTVTGSIALRAL